MNIENMKQFINNKVIQNNLNDTGNSYIMSFIIKNNIIYTENKNGYFVNLNNLDNDKIIELYDYVFNYINITQEDYNNTLITQTIINTKPIVKKSRQSKKLTDIENTILKKINDIFKY